MTLFVPTLAAATSSSSSSSSSSSTGLFSPSARSLAGDDAASASPSRAKSPLASALEAIATKGMTQIFAFAGGAMAPTLGRDASSAHESADKAAAARELSYVLARRLAHPFRSAQVGDVVAFAHPSERERVLIRRVTAIEGDELVDAANASVYVVPNAHCWVTSDADTESGTTVRYEDSRTFGPIELRAIEWRVMYSFDSAVNHGRVGNSAEASIADAPVLREDLRAAKEAIGF